MTEINNYKPAISLKEKKNIKQVLFDDNHTLKSLKIKQLKIFANNNSRLFALLLLLEFVQRRNLAFINFKIISAFFIFLNYNLHALSLRRCKSNIIFVHYVLIFFLILLIFIINFLNVFTLRTFNRN